MTTYTIKNDFHGTECRIRCEGVQHIHGVTTIYPSRGQCQKLHRELCGHDDCTCGDVRGPQFSPCGARLEIDRWAMHVR